jgi:PAS domain S-box-containing protein
MKKPETMAMQSDLILAVDDYQPALYAYSRVLRKAQFEVREAATGGEALRIVVDERPDLVLLDVNLPDMDGFEVCRRIKSDPYTARIPVLHISASAVKHTDQVRGLEGGADGYLTEPVSPEVLVATIRSMLRARRAEQTARELARQWQGTFDALADGIAILDRGGRVLRSNSSLARIFGKQPDELLGRACYTLWHVPPGADSELVFPRMLRTGRREEADAMQSGRWFHMSCDPLRDDAGGLTGAVYLVRDVTDRRRVEEEFRQTQKLESIGTLAAGVAHDFNNLLTGILGNASLALRDLEPSSPAREKLQDVIRSSDRAAQLTSQLLAYSGKGKYVVRNLDLSELITEMRNLLRTSVPRKAELQFRLAADLPRIAADALQIQQVIVNLIMNAGEAIGEESGVICINTSAHEILPEATGERAPGLYVVLEVADTGCGMTQEVQSQLFDPFFTTKFLGRGLGLAAVSGIVRGHKGYIEVESSPGKGAKFCVLLPSAVREVPAAPRTTRSSGIILVVDDEQIIRSLATAVLERSGYTVLTAENGSEAVEMIRQQPESISLVLLDIAMPVMGGAEAAEKIVAINPKIKILVSSGYDQDNALLRFPTERLAGFLQKPYTAEHLLERIEALLK